VKLDLRECESLVWLQNENSSLFVEEASAVEGYRAVIRCLDEVSLDADRSKAMIGRLVESLN
jgi:hypothetical protein